MLRKNIDQSFIRANVDISWECWNWKWFRDLHGYWRSTRRFGTRLAHRISFSLFIKEIPPWMMVCHKCDNTSCVNPEHLFLGDSYDNMRDMIEKWRQRYVWIRNCQNACKKVMVDWIRFDSITLASKYLWISIEWTRQRIRRWIQWYEYL